MLFGPAGSSAGKTGADDTFYRRCVAGGHRERLDDLRAGLLILRGSAANHTESATVAEKYYLEVLIIARQRGAKSR